MAVLGKWVDKYGIHDKDENPMSSGETPEERRRRLRMMTYQASLDLHGLALQEALERLESFLIHGKKSGWEKVLIIHGKGNHSKGSPVLKQKIKHYLQESSRVGEIGIAEKKDGGSGALWCILR